LLLKAHYPVEYMAALLTSVKSNLDKAGVYLNECRILGIEVVVPTSTRPALTSIRCCEDDDGLGQIVLRPLSRA
jgi:DNA polymerase III alpha subunit